jgi:hypothetical protein
MTFYAIVLETVELLVVTGDATKLYPMSLPRRVPLSVHTFECQCKVLFKHAHVPDEQRGVHEFRHRRLFASAPRPRFWPLSRQHARNLNACIGHSRSCATPWSPHPLLRTRVLRFFNPKSYASMRRYSKCAHTATRQQNCPLTNAQEDDEETELSDGFWQEFFLHRPDSAGLKRILDSVPPDEMLHLQSHSQQLVRSAINRVKQGKQPSDEIALEVRCRQYMTLSQAYGPDLDSLPRCCPGEEVHQP